MSKKRQVGNGEGSLYYDKSKKILIYAYWYNKKLEKLRQKKTESNTDFRKRVTELKHQLNNNIYVSENETSLYSILESYIDNKYKTGITKARTYKRDKGSLKLLKKLCKKIIDKPIQKITVADIKSVLPNFVQNGQKTYSQNTIGKLYRLMKKGFEIASSERIIQYNPMINVSVIKPKSIKRTVPVEALTIDEQKILVDYFKENDHKFKNIILLQLYTGMRIGEVLALKFSDITENAITVRRTLTRDANDKTILGETTKTNAGLRTVYLSKNAKVLAKDILNNKLSNIHELVFWDYDKNKLYSPNQINCYLQRLNNKIRVCDHIHTHMLRHTYATRCIEAGMNPKVLQKQLGHTDIETTLNTYTSVFEKFNQDENEKVNEYMESLGI